MQTNKAKLHVLNPRANNTAPFSQGAPPLLADFGDKKIGILDNTKAGGSELWPSVQDALEKEIPGLEFRRWKVPFALASEIKAPRLKEIVEFSDGVVAFMGD